MNQSSEQQAKLQGGIVRQMNRRLPVPGEMAERIRNHDWSLTPLGPSEQWSDSLIIALNAILANQHPKILLWGDDLIHFYNDAAISSLGTSKHPHALGRRADECWSESWSIIGPPIYAARYGQSSWKEDQFTPIYRNGHVESAWFTSSYSPIRDAQGNIEGVVITRLETTGKILAERALRREQARLLEQKERFEFATEAAEIGYWFCNLPFDKLIWDRRVKEHFWLAPEVEVNIALFYERIHPNDRDRTRLAIENSIANHTRYDVEYRTVAPDGRQKWIRAIGRTAYDEAGAPVRFDGVTMDVTDLKKAQDTLAAGRAKTDQRR